MQYPQRLDSPHRLDNATSALTNSTPPVQQQVQEEERKAFQIQADAECEPL